MMTRRSNLLAAVALAAALAVPSVALAGGGGLGILNATLPEQILQEVTAMEQLGKQAEEVSNQLRQIDYMARNLQSLPQNMWSQTYGDLNQLTNIVSQANGLSYAMQNVDSEFQSKYPSYSPSENYDQQFQQWNQTTSNSIAGALQAQGLNAQNFATQQAALQQIEAASQSATGRMQVLQAGNQIASMEVTQLQQLQQIQSADSDAQLAWIKQKETEKSQAVSAETQEYNSWTSGAPAPAQGQSYGSFSAP